MNDLPIQKLMDLKKSGLDNDRIFQVLMKEGYTSEQITESLRRIQMTNQVGNMANPPYPNGPNLNQAPPMPPQGMPRMQAPARVPRSNFQEQSAHISQIAEAIIEEKWKSLMDNVNKIALWKDNTQVKISKLENDVELLRKEFDNLNKAIMNRIGESDSAVKNVSVDLKALTTVFEKILPGFIDNMHSLERITKDLESIKNDMGGTPIPKVEMPIRNVEPSSNKRTVTKKTVNVIERPTSSSGSSNRSKQNVQESQEDIFETIDEVKEDLKKARSKKASKKSASSKSSKSAGPKKGQNDIFDSEEQEESIDDLF